MPSPAAAHHTPEASPVPAFGGDLFDLAHLPLEHVLASGAIGGDERIHPVSHIESKAQAAHSPGVRFVAVSSQQTDDRRDSPLGQSCQGLSVVKADSLTDLLGALHHKLRDDLFGPIVPLPDVLRHTQANAQHRHTSHDYRAESYHPFDWLERKIGDAIRSNRDPSLSPSVQPSPNTLRKTRDRGFIHVEAMPGAGKTSFALNWVRQSMGLVATTPDHSLPRLSGWYFARRYGTQGTSTLTSPVDALQTLASIARQTHGLPCQTPDAARLLTVDQAKAYAAPEQAVQLEHELRSNFVSALKVIAQRAHISQDKPLVLLIDGCDEMSANIPGTQHARSSFPRIFPTIDELPAHCYIVILSRSGMVADNDKWRPMLHCKFQAGDIADSIDAYLDKKAASIAAIDAQSATEWRDVDLRTRIHQACGDAFGYVPMLWEQWTDLAPADRLQRLKDWQQEQTVVLPDGVYGMHADELIGWLNELGSAEERNVFLRSMAALTQLRWPLSADEFVELLHPGTTGNDHSQLPDLYQHIKLMSTWVLCGEGGTQMAMQFAHQTLAEVALACWQLWHAQARTNRKLPENKVLVSRAMEIAGYPVNAPSGLRPQQAQRADAWLHAEIVGRDNTIGCRQRWQDQSNPQPMRPWWTQETAVNTATGSARAYALVWGPWHALKASAGLHDEHAPLKDWVELGQRVRGLLTHAPYLQSAIRAQAAFARAKGLPSDAQALRETFIAADALTSGSDTEQTLRHRIEGHLVEWHHYLDEGSLQVGGLLWNMLGADEEAKTHAQGWKDSLDTDALITQVAGKSPPFARMIPAKQSAVTPCGRWLVTADERETLVWGLSAGWHRTLVVAKVPWAVGGNMCAVASGNLIGVAGTGSIGTDSRIWLGYIDLDNGSNYFAKYSGFTGKIRTDWNEINPISIQKTKYKDDLLWVVCAGSWDGEIGIVAQSTADIQNAASTTDHSDAEGIIILWERNGNIKSVSMQIDDNDGEPIAWIASGSGSSEHNFGFIRVNISELYPFAKYPGNLSKWVSPVIGHESGLRSVSLHPCLKINAGKILTAASVDFTGVLGLHLVLQENSTGKITIKSIFKRIDDYFLNSVSLTTQIIEGNKVLLIASSGSNQNIHLVSVCVTIIESQNSIELELSGKNKLMKYATSDVSIELSNENKLTERIPGHLSDSTFNGVSHTNICIFQQPSAGFLNEDSINLLAAFSTKNGMIIYWMGKCLLRNFPCLEMKDLVYKNTFGDKIWYTFLHSYSIKKTNYVGGISGSDSNFVFIEVNPNTYSQTTKNTLVTSSRQSNNRLNLIDNPIDGLKSVCVRNHSTSKGGGLIFTYSTANSVAKKFISISNLDNIDHVNAVFTERKSLTPFSINGMSKDSHANHIISMMGNKFHGINWIYGDSGVILDFDFISKSNTADSINFDYSLVCPFSELGFKIMDIEVFNNNSVIITGIKSGKIAFMLGSFVVPLDQSR